MEVLHSIGLVEMSKTKLAVGNFYLKDSYIPFTKSNKLRNFITKRYNISKPCVCNACTMSAKRLGTLAMIYATDELQNPFPLKTMLCEGDTNNPVRTSDAFLYN